MGSFSTAVGLEASSESNPQAFTDSVTSDEILFSRRPSLFSEAGSLARCLALLAGASLLLYFPLEDIGNDLLSLGLNESQALLFGRYRVIAGAAIAGIVLLCLLVKIVRLKAICYEVTADRIEWTRGILNRRIDNLDMFRVVDLKLRRGLFDWIVGIGTVTLITTDKTDPEFVFEKMRRPRELYDVIKKASLEAALQGSVVHLEQD